MSPVYVLKASYTKCVCPYTCKTFTSGLCWDMKLLKVLVNLILLLLAQANIPLLNGLFIWASFHDSLVIRIWDYLRKTFLVSKGPVHFCWHLLCVGNKEWSAGGEMARRELLDSPSDWLAPFCLFPCTWFIVCVIVCKVISCSSILTLDLVGY